MKVDAPVYKPSKARTDRVVLAELFTGAGCPPCVGADLAFEAALERYSSDGPRAARVSPAHSAAGPDDQPVDPDAEGVLRRAGHADVLHRRRATSTSAAARRRAPESVRGDVRPVVDKRLEVKPGADIDVKAHEDRRQGRGDERQIGKAKRQAGRKPRRPARRPTRKLGCQVALVEEMVHYTGENGVRFHPMVVRSLAGTGKRRSRVPAGDREGREDRLHVRHRRRPSPMRRRTSTTWRAAAASASASSQFIERKNGIDPRTCGSWSSCRTRRPRKSCRRERGRRGPGSDVA